MDDNLAPVTSEVKPPVVPPESQNSNNSTEKPAETAKRETSAPIEGLVPPVSQETPKATPTKKIFICIVIIVASLLLIATGFFAYTKYLTRSDAATSVVIEEAKTPSGVSVSDPKEVVTDDISALEKDVTDLDAELTQLEEDLNLDIDFSL